MRHNRRALTLAELLVSSTVFSLLTAGFVISYKSSYTSFSQGSEKTMSMRLLREAVNRIQPLISSACPVTASSNAVYEPDFVASPGTTSSQIRFTTLKEYAEVNIQRLGAPVHIFSPINSSADQYQEARLFFDKTVDPARPGGQVGRVKLDLSTPSNTGDDLILARDLYDCSFTNVGANTIVLKLETRRFLRRTMGARDVQAYKLETRLFIPYYSNTAGGGG
ncbi:MAG: hypothetical protein KF760_32515 [Candidatus Eremiobacteraeota bacterium]|nr:hypothetical protein [Candidatus Eremiobacteraeota bacterium]MCW5870343.1 hypothetical protein [Candidatus Eremiobacteraeota bacterium]